MKRIVTNPADRVVLVLVGQNLSDKDLHYVGSRLDGLPVVVGYQGSTETAETGKVPFVRLGRDHLNGAIEEIRTTR